MKKHRKVFMLVFLSLLIALPAHAARLACTATYDNSTGALNIDAVEVGTSRYVVKLSAITGGTSLRFKLDSATLATLATSRDCFDPATISGTTMTIPDIAVSDSFYNATLTLVTGNGPTQIDLATSSPSTMQFDLASSSKNPRLVPDAGIRVEKAGIPFATVNSSTGTTYLGYISAVDNSENFQSSTDGLTFSTPTLLTLTNRAVDSRITHLPDGTYRLYLIDQNTGIMTSYFSSDGNVFGPTLESGTRYTATADDKISGQTPYTGVYDLYTATSDGAVVLVYLGDLNGKNNLRMAKSTDNGVNFTFVKGNVLGDENTGYAFVDNKTVLLADGRRRMFTMRGGQLQSFVTTDGYAWSREVGTRISYYDFASVGVTLYTLNDPVPVFDKNGNLKVYVAGATGPNSSTPGNTNWGIASATWNANVGSGVLGSNGVCGSTNGQSFTIEPTSNLCTTGTSSSVTGSGPWSWACAGSNGGVAAACTGNIQTWTINAEITGSGTVSCTSTVNNGATSTCTIAASTGYQLSNFTDNGVDKLSSVSSNSYSITNVTASHNIVATFTLSTSSATIKIGASTGTKLKSLLGENAGPLAAGTQVNKEFSTQYKSIGVNAIRTHDFLIYSSSIPSHNPTLYPGPLDMSTMYPDFSKDPTLSSSYNFTLSDQHFGAIVNGGFEPFFRLGDSAGLIKPPQATERPNWERAAIEVLKHYTQGQWNGFNASISEVEIWNEPDSTGFWTLTQSEYMSLYVETAAALHAAFPTLRIGGPGFTHAAVISPTTGGWLYTFLDQVKAANVPLDFISFHVYSNDSNQPAAPATLLRTILDTRGFNSTKIYVTEWNTYANAATDLTSARAYRSGALGTSTLTTSWIKMQDAPVDRLFHYRGSDPNANTLEDYGLYTGSGTPKRTAWAFQLWATVASTQSRLATTVTGNSNLLAIAGNDSNNKPVILVVNTANSTSSWSPTDSNGQALSGTWQLETISDDNAGKVTTTPTFPIAIPAYGVQLLTETGTQTTLKAGWNLMGWTTKVGYYQVTTPLSTEHASSATMSSMLMSDMFGTLGLSSTDSFVVVGPDGVVYMPGSPFNTLKKALPGKAYWIYTPSAKTITVPGGALLPTDQLSLNIGWTQIAYWGTDGVAPATGFNCINGTYDILVDEAGKVYMSGSPFNTLKTLQKNKGYFIHTTTPATLVYQCQ